MRSRKKLVTVGVLSAILCASQTIPAFSYDREFEQKFKYKQQQHRFKMDQMKRDHEKRRKEFRERQNSRASTSRSSSYPSSRSTRSGYTPTRAASTGSAGVYKSVTDAQMAFKPASAPRPDLCFLKFVQASKGASSCKQLYPYLPSNFVVKLEQGADKTSDKQSYYNKKRDYYKEIANNVINVVDYKVLPRDENGVTIARLKVKVRNKSKHTGKKYKYRNDTIKMIGEGNYWKFKSRSKNTIVYNDKPLVPRKTYP